jgi:hypothetical protein
MFKLFRKRIAVIFLALVLPPARIHVWADRLLKDAETLNIKAWTGMGRRVFAIYEWIRGPDRQ